MADDNDRQDTDLTIDRNGTSFLVPLGISVVFIVLALAWVSMSGHEDASSPQEVLTRPSSPAGSTTPQGK
jgi:hypothetical protein